MNYTFESDPNGNLYLITPDSTTYQINITSQNIPYPESGNYKILKKKKTKHHPIIITKDNKSEVSEILTNQNEIIPDLNDDEQIVKYIPEMDVFDEQTGTEKNNFIIYQNNEDIKVNERKYGEYPALYDTYIYDKGNLIFKSVNGYCLSSYILKVIDNERISFREVGSFEKYYKIMVEDNKIIFLE